MKPGLRDGFLLLLLFFNDRVYVALAELELTMQPVSSEFTASHLPLLPSAEHVPRYKKKKITSFILCVCVCGNVPHVTYMKVLGQHGGVCSLLPPRGS